MESSTNDDVNEKLKLVCSIGTFQSTNINSFRNDLRWALKDVVKRSSNNTVNQKSEDDDDGFVHESYNSNIIEQSMSDFIEWKALCEYHDKQILRRQQVKKRKREVTLPPGGGISPLEEVLSAISLPTVIPRCCAGCVLSVLIKAFIQAPRIRGRRTSSSKASTATISSSSSRWSPAQATILQSIKQLYMACPSMRCKPMRSVFLLEDFDKAVPNEWNRLLSLSNILAKDIPRLHFCMTSFVMDVIRRIDDHDVRAILNNKETIKSDDASANTSTKDDHVCSRCGGCTTDDNHDFNDNPTQSRRMKRATLSNLHDEDLTVRDEGQKSNTRTMMWSYRPKYQKQVTLTAVLKESDIGQRKKSPSMVVCRCNSPSKKNSNQQQLSCSVFPPEWRLVRSRGYKKFVSIFQQLYCHAALLPVPSSRNRSQSKQSQAIRRFDISLLLKLARKHYHSPCIRVCVLISLDGSMGVAGIGTKRTQYPFPHISMLKSCWRSYLNSKDEIWLRIYSELLVECKVFRERTLCWDLFSPILRRLLENEEEEHGIENIDERSLLRCVAYILSRWYRMFLPEKSDDQISVEFRQSLSILKIRYGDVQYWIDEDMDPYEKERTFGVLEKIQILGVVDLIDRSLEIEKGDSGQSDQELGRDPREGAHSECRKTLMTLATKSWPFHKPFDIRSTSSRLGNEVCIKLLSFPKHDENIDVKGELGGNKNAVVNVKKYDGPSISEFFDDDICRTIFSYFGYQRLVTMREVCQTWKRVVDKSNILWYEAYSTRFGFVSEDPKHVWGQVNIDWKKMFISKWFVEDSLENRRNATTGWMYRTCRYVGCHHILRSENAEKKHYGTHSRKRKAVTAKVKSSHLTSKQTSPKGHKKK